MIVALLQLRHVGTCRLHAEQLKLVDPGGVLLTLVRSDEDGDAAAILKANEAELNGFCRSRRGSDRAARRRRSRGELTLALNLRLGQLQLLRSLKRFGIIETESRTRVDEQTDRLGGLSDLGGERGEADGADLGDLLELV